ncbi:MAG: porin, partial [Betaproteobacteria bacterium]
APAVTTQDNFTRWAAYANYYVVPKMVNVLAGYAEGRESLGDGSVVPTAGKSSGYFGEVDYHATGKWAVGLRYDEFKPTDKSLATGTKESTQTTLAANYYVTNGLQFIADYQLRDDKLAQGGTNKTDTLTARMIFIW